MTTSDNFERISTGNPQADQILSGGFPSNSINIIMGLPGTGKTIFAERLVFHNATAPRPILYLTTMSEPLAKMIRYVQRFSFFDASKLGTDIIYDDLSTALSESGIDALVPYMTLAIRNHSPKIIVIDAFKDVHDLAPSVYDMRQVLYELSSMFTAYETTVFLLGPYTEDNSKVLPEFSVADGILQFMRQKVGAHDERFLQVLKLRGSPYKEGFHAFHIGHDGLEIFPRLVTPKAPEDYKIIDENVPTGIEGLDKMFGGGLLHSGGLLKGSTTLVSGPTGSGKTTIALQFATTGVEHGDPTLFVNFQENPVQLARAVHAMGGELKALKARGLHVMYTSPVELQIDSLIESIFRQIDEQKIKRVVVDALGDLASAATDEERMHDYLYSLLQHLTSLNVTSLFTFKSQEGLVGGAASQQSTALYSDLYDNVIMLSVEVQDAVKRTLAIIKARACNHDLKVRQIEITAKGARLK